MVSPRLDLAPFTVETAREGDTLRVTPVGELDIATVAEVESRLSECGTDGYEKVVLDLSELRFIDSRGVQLVLDWDSQALVDGFHFALIEGPDAVQRVFELSGVEQRLSFLPDRASQANQRTG